MVMNMGAETIYMCEKCGFKINDHDLLYFVDEETNCVVEHTFGMATFNMGGDSKIKGRIILSFCPDCSSEVHFYYNETESNVKEIKSALEQNEEDFKEILDEKYVHRTISSVLKGAVGPKDTHGECPKCSKNIPLIAGNKSECPKCGGKLYGLTIALYD